MTQDLERYEGRYLVGVAWHEGKELSRLLKIKRVDNHLVAASETSTSPLGSEFLPIDDSRIERGHSEERRLTAAGEHAFDAVGFPRRYRFMLGETKSVDSVVVTRDGEPSEPCPRFVELPEPIPGRRERGEWFDLGNPTICMTLRNAEALFPFYERLGFTLNPSRPNNVINGWSVIGFLDFQYQSCINYRGPSIVETAFELARRGYPVSLGQVETTGVQGNGAGSVSVPDPDGHHIFFNTHLPERPIYEAWLNGELPHERTKKAFNVGGTEDQNTKELPVTLPLGDLVACLGCMDLGASVSFYQGMGFEVLERTSSSAIIHSRPARQNKFAFPLRLSEETEPKFSFGFLCDDVASLCAEIQGRGVDMIVTAGGPAFVDPDGNTVTLFPLSS